MIEIQKKTTAEQAVNKITADVYGSFGPDAQRIVGKTLQLLAHRCPVPPDEISTQLQIRSDDIVSILKKWNAEFDRDGNVVGMGLTFVPTPHVYEAGGLRMYAWCAPDALAFPVLLNHTARIESSDPVTGEKIRFTVTPDGIEQADPEGAVVSWVKSIDVANIRQSGCLQMHFFVSPETASRWIAERPHVTFYTADEAFEALKKIHLEKYKLLLSR